MSRIQIVDTIVEKDGEILMLKRNFYPRNKLDFPGGHVDDGETIEEAAIRETLEESGFVVQLAEKLGEYDYTDRGEKTAHVFIGTIVGGEIKKSLEGRPMWVDLKNVKDDDLAFPQAHRRAIEDYLAKK